MPEPKWTSVKEKLPEGGDHVLLCFKSADTAAGEHPASYGIRTELIGNLFPVIWFNLNLEELVETTHWMPAVYDVHKQVIYPHRFPWGEKIK